MNAVLKYEYGSSFLVILCKVIYIYMFKKCIAFTDSIEDGPRLKISF